jgi:hypothetical protein
LAITGSLLVLAKEPLPLTEADSRWIAVGPTLMLCVGGFASSAASDHLSRETVMLVGLISSILTVLIPPMPTAGHGENLVIPNPIKGADFLT